MAKFLSLMFIVPFLMTIGCNTFTRKEAAPARTPASSQALAEVNSTYSIPTASAPQGQLQILTLGQTQLRSRADDAVQLPALHLRMIVHNGKSDLGWNLDARQQQIRFSGSDEAIGPVYVQAESHTFPFIRITKAATSVIDLYYILPPALAMGHAPTFQVSWQMIAGDQSAAALSPNKHIYPDPTPDVYPLEQIAMSSRTPSSAVAAAGSVSGASSSASDSLGSSSGASQSASDSVAGAERKWWQDPFVDVPF